MPQGLTQAPEWLFDYDHCSLEELRAFIEDRTSAAVKERKILAAHFRRMDQAREFPSFMELPPELRINIYETLLVDNRTRDEKGWLKDERDKCTLHTAVLRTSKQVYSEARPVLYDRNKFSVMIGYTWKGSRPSSAQLGKNRIGLRVVRPGARFSYHKLIGSADCPSPLELSLLRWPMLRGLKHVTVDLGLMTPEPPTIDSSNDSSDDSSDDLDHPVTYAVHAREAMTAVCLSLIGACKLEQLTIKITFEDSQASDADLAEILWPLIFLRSDIVVRIEGLSEVLQRERSADYEERAREKALISHQKRTAFVGQVAKVRKRCAEGNDDIMELLAKLTPLGVWVDMTDIVSSNVKWTALQRKVDALEV
jgi:hypothetical protein